MNEPSTSGAFKRYIWEDFSQKRGENRAKSEQEYQEWLNTPEEPEEPKMDYLIGPGEARSQAAHQSHHGKEEKTVRKQSLKEKKKKKSEPYVIPKEREQGLWPDEYERDDDILHVRSTYVDK